MAKFNPNRQLEILEDSCGYRLDLDSNFDKVKAVNGLGGSAHAFLGTAVTCVLVGLDKPASELLTKSCSWLKEAIEYNEKPQRYAEDGTEAARFRDYALCNWLLVGKHDVTSYQEFVRHEDRFLVKSGLGQDKREVSFILPSYVDARAYDRALEVFENVPGFSPPSSIMRLNSEADLTYIICRHRLGMEYSDGEVAHACSRFLTKNMDKWLGNGHAVRAAQWIKIVYGTNRDINLSPRQLLMRCYEHLPGCKRLS